MNHIHPNTKIHPTALIEDSVIIEEDVEIGAYTVIGSRGEIRSDKPKNGRVIIKKGTIIREQVTVQASVDGNDTVIGENCYIMNKTHIAHDVIIGDNCTISTGTIIGGHCRVGSYANFGLGAMIHQRLTVGIGAMVGMGTVVTKDIPPTLTVTGSPCRILGINERGLIRWGFDLAMVKDLKRVYAAVINGAEFDSDNPLVLDLRKFINGTNKPLIKFVGEG